MPSVSSERLQTGFRFGERSVTGQAQPLSPFYPARGPGYTAPLARFLLDLVDLRFPAFLHPPALARPLLDTDPGSLACSVSGPGTIPPPGPVSPPA